MFPTDFYPSHVTVHNSIAEASEADDYPPKLFPPQAQCVAQRYVVDKELRRIFRKAQTRWILVPVTAVINPMHHAVHVKINARIDDKLAEFQSLSCQHPPHLQNAE